MPGKPLTDVEIGQIEAYRNCGKGPNEIARILKRSRKTVSRFMKPPLIKKGQVEIAK